MNRRSRWIWTTGTKSANLSDFLLQLFVGQFGNFLLFLLEVEFFQPLSFLRFEYWPFYFDIPMIFCKFLISSDLSFHLNSESGVRDTFV